MTKRFWVYSGDRPSNGAKELAACEGFLRLRNGHEHKVKPGDVLINWGCTALGLAPVVFSKILNKPEKIYLAADKLKAFTMFAESEVSAVEWTFDQSVAQIWCDQEYVIVVRNKLTGHSGDGIVIIDKCGEVPQAPLYTKYIFKEREFRVHVVCGKVVDTARKIKDPDREVTNWKVRSHENGFIFARQNINPSQARDDLALAAVVALGLDFGAVDILEDKKGKFYVLEVNTGPGLEGQTITSYEKAFKDGS